jgi:hypothetical protein
VTALCAARRADDLRPAVIGFVKLATSLAQDAADGQRSQDGWHAPDG